MTKKGIYHLTDDGPKLCQAKTGPCPYGGEHFEGIANASQAYERQMQELVLSSFKRPNGKGKSSALANFSEDEYYGDWKPRTVQLEALNGVREALAEDDQTQLVAACGTGKTYMGRQLMRHLMEEPDANGVAIVLTSSIRLAVDTAADLRPDRKGAYDHSFGNYGEDYEVIEIHSDNNEMKSEGAVDSEKIAQRWRDALNAGKKVVIVSTYQSADKVKLVQASIGERAEADLLMNDEAHNILGQKNNSGKLVGRAALEDAEEEESTDDEASQSEGYVSFHNEIPGAIQAKKRLYATATPVISEPNSQKATIENPTTALADLQARARAMEKDRKLRMTVFSTDEIVGKIGGFITKEAAVKENCLADSNYQLRSAQVVGVKTPEDLVDNRGHAVLSSDASKKYLTAQTYAAVTSTLDALVEEPGKESNGSHNALVYAKGIAQAEAFSENFSTVALELSDNMDLAVARGAVNSPDDELRRKARLRLLAEEATVRVAHSKSSENDKKAAFAMFKGKDIKLEDAQAGWSPKKNILSNVDIFSEGISLNEIDTVVIANPTKTSEKALTQAAGRAARKISGNDYKRIGHVIVPKVVDETGMELNGSFVNRAAYGASSLERSVTVKSLTGVAVPEDTSTKFTVYGANGTTTMRAYDLVHSHDNDARAYVAAQTIELVRRNLAKKNRSDSEEKRMETDHFRSVSPEEQDLLVRSVIANRANSANKQYAGVHWNVAHEVLSVNSGPLNRYSQANVVPTLALGKDDYTFVSPDIRSTMTKAGIIGASKADAKGLSYEDKSSYLQGRKREALSILVNHYSVTSDSPKVQRLVNAVSQGEKINPGAFGYLSTGVARGGSSVVRTAIERDSQVYEERFNELLKNKQFAEELYDAMASADKGIVKAFSTPKDALKRKNIDLDGELASVRNRALERASAEVVRGEAGYQKTKGSFTDKGFLSANALQAFAEAL